MGKTSIEWTDHSINPIRAKVEVTGAVGHYCEKISSGCAKCYASNLQKRFRMPSFGRVKTDLPEGVEVFLDENQLYKVLARRKPTKYFWCDMTDMFGWWVPDEWIDKCLAVMALTPQHTHQVLTKRPDRAAEYFNRPGRHGFWGHWAWCFWAEKQEIAWAQAPRWLEHRERIVNPPLPNVWLGTSVENQKAADERIPHLLKIPAAVRFLSCEPLLGPVNLNMGNLLHLPPCPQSPCNQGTWKGLECDCREYHPNWINWVIVGGESGHDARRCEVQWIADIRDQCQAAGVPCFIKQLGAEPYWGWPQLPAGIRVRPDNHSMLNLRDKKGGDWDEWPEDLRVREFPSLGVTGG